MSERRQALIYVELKSNCGDRGPAWICRPKFSKSGRTVYFNGRALRRIGGQGIAGNHRCVETGEEYWVSGVKKDGRDRHWAGGGPVMIAADVLDEYLEFRGLSQLDPAQHRIVSDIVDTDMSRFHALENADREHD